VQKGDLIQLRSISKRTPFAALLIVVLCASLAVPALAGAQQVSPTNDQYDNELTQVSQGANPKPPAGNDGAPTASASGLSGNVGPLPFTGFDVIAMLAVALVVAGAGLALQRAVSRQPTDGLN
jgi:hypothetical protein